ncbi:MAG: ferritin family protein [Candidatus Korobacteraceae bacterium]
MKRSFAALDAQEALHVAIFIEERNAEIYHRFAEMFTEFRDPESLEIAGVFWEMAVEERRHSSMLQARYTLQYGNASCSLTEEELVEFVEVPRLEDGDIFTVNGSGADARESALEVALTAEVSAQLFYAHLADSTGPGPLRAIYQELAQMEDGHVDFLKAKLERDNAEDRSVQ